MVCVAFAGSFDPPHIGHRFIVDSCLKAGFTVKVFVANNIDKKQTDILVRKDMCDDMFPDVDVIVTDDKNIGVAFKENGCTLIVRGLRDAKDFEYEQVITRYNWEVNGLQTIYIPCPEELSQIRSSLIRKELENDTLST